MDEAEQIRTQKIEQLQEQTKKQQDLRQAQAQLDALLRRLLTEDAKSRLSNVRLANPPLYQQAVQSLLLSARSGQLTGKLDDAALKDLLLKLRGNKREITITRK